MSHDAMQHHDLLITGFGPFPGVTHNPSALLARALGADRSFVRRGWRVRTKVLTVGYGIVAKALADEAKHAPRAVLMFGVAAKSKRVRIELRAVNRVSRNAKDATHALPGDARLEHPPAKWIPVGGKSGCDDHKPEQKDDPVRSAFALGRCDAVFRPARAPVCTALRAMRQAGVGAEYSRSAGRYVCNAAYWRALGVMPPQTLVLFVHIPLLMKPGMRKRDGRPAFQALLKGAKGVALAMMKAARFKPSAV